MARSTTGTRRYAWLPARADVIAEKAFVPGGTTAARRVAARLTPTYRIIRTAELDPYEAPAAALLAFGEARRRAPGDNFTGTSRKSAKLSISAAAVEHFDDLRTLVDSLPSIQSMADREPPITTDARSRRVEEEERNARVRAFLYAASREDDRDYHLIVGSDPDARQKVCMTMEISGLPAARSRHRARLEAARNAFKDFFTDDLPGSGYDFYDPPIPLDVTGSLFFDKTHSTGTRPGPHKLRPLMPTIWEIHPISAIVFEP